MRMKWLAPMLVAGLAVLAAAGSAGGAIALQQPGNIRITDRLVVHTHVDVAHGRSSAGNFDFYRELLYNKGITSKPIGHSDMTCISTGTGSSNCNGTYFLPKGEIMVGGVIDSRLFYELGVLGGTGVYSNVRGTLTTTYLGGLPSRDFLLFQLGI
jgi:hypothetical protein